MAAKKDDKKKEEKPFVDKYTLMSTEDLLKIVETHHAEENSEARAALEEKIKLAVRGFDAVENQYFLNKRGASSDNPAVPAKLSLDKKKAKEEATELINHLLMESVKRELGEDGAKVYKAKPEMLVGYAASKGINFYDLRAEMVERYRDVTKSDKYSKAKQALAAGSVEALRELTRARNELIMDYTRHGRIREKANTRFQEKHGVEINEGIALEDVLNHYQTSLEGKVNKDYVTTSENETHFKPYEKKDDKGSKAKKK